MSKSELTPWDALVTHIHDSGVAWVEADLKARQLEEDQKPFLASIMNELEKKLNTPGYAIPVDPKKEGRIEFAPEKLSESKLDRMARGSQQYRDYIVGMCAAKAAALKAKVDYESWTNLFEAKRTEAATERVKLEKGIFHVGR